MRRTLPLLIAAASGVVLYLAAPAGKAGTFLSDARVGLGTGGITFTTMF